MQDLINFSCPTDFYFGTISGKPEFLLFPRNLSFLFITWKKSSSKQAVTFQHFAVLFNFERAQWNFFLKDVEIKSFIVERHITVSCIIIVRLLHCMIHSPRHCFLAQSNYLFYFLKARKMGNASIIQHDPTWHGTWPFLPSKNKYTGDWFLLMFTFF